MRKWKEFTDGVATVHYQSGLAGNPITFGHACMVALYTFDDQLYSKIVRTPDIDPFICETHIPDFFKFLQKEWGVA